MEIGIQLVNGFLLGIRLFAPIEEAPYNEIQIFAGVICFYIIWD